MNPLVEICMVLNGAEQLLPLQYKFWKHDPRVRLLIGDTTPVSSLPPNGRFIQIDQPRKPWTEEGFDGYQHGNGLDQLVMAAETEYVILQDPDVFWLKPDLIDRFLAMDVDCFGIGDVYNSIVGVFSPETVFPNGGMLNNVTPFCSGMICRRSETLGVSFKLTYGECQDTRREVGWRIRDRMRERKLKVRSLLGFCYPHTSPQGLGSETHRMFLGSAPTYGSPHDPWVMHFTQYYRMGFSGLEPMKKCLRECSQHWKSILESAD